MKQAERKTNYHTHTTRCNHAVGTDEAYVRSAIKAGYTELGFSEHGPWCYASSYCSHMRLALQDFEEYFASIRALALQYRGEITIKIGLESEYFPDYMDGLHDFVREKKLDYVLFGNHFYLTDETGPYFGNATTTVPMLNKYVESSVRGMEDGLYAYFAHPDLFMRSYPLFDENAVAASREICRAAKRLGMPLEYNLAGMIFNRATGIEGYPHNKFWEIAAAEGCTAIVGVDAHDNRHFAEEGIRSAAEQLLRKLGMPLIDTIPFLTEV